MQFIGQDGIILKEDKHDNVDTIYTASYQIQPTDQYVRTVLTFYDNTMMWLNPITRHESTNIEKQRLDHISYWWTAALWGVYIGIIALIVILIKRK